LKNESESGFSDRNLLASYSCFKSTPPKTIHLSAPTSQPPPPSSSSSPTLIFVVESKEKQKDEAEDEKNVE
jgi:hypothetical protein